MYSFNLIDQPWIPCVMSGSGHFEHLGIRDTLLQAGRIHEIADPSPLITPALHRLLLAILHRNFGPATEDNWFQLWEAASFPSDVLDRYFVRWRCRFDLLDPERPFYQAKSVRAEYAVPAAKLVPELASGNNATLFDHTTEEHGAPFALAKAARSLVALQSFAVGGLVSLEKGQDPKQFKSARGAPLVKGAVALVKGQNLVETLLLNLHRYSASEGEPFPCTGSDLPAWEKECEPKAADRYPTGYLDLLTWQSRRVRLLAESTPDGQLAVSSVVIMKGEQIPEDWPLRGRETMLAFKKNPNAKGDQPAWFPVSHQPERAVWRDSLALVESMADQTTRPKTVDWLHDLVVIGYLPRRAVLSLDLMGLSTDQAKVLMWRHERMPLPLTYLHNAPLVEQLGLSLSLAEQTATILLGSVGNLVRQIQAPEVNGQARQPDRKRVRSMVGIVVSRPVVLVATGRRVQPVADRPCCRPH